MNPMDWVALEFWLVAGQLVITVVGGLIGRAIKRNSDRIDKLEEKLEVKSGHIAALQAAQITHEDLGRVYRRLDGVIDSVSGMKSDLSGAVSEVKGELTATSNQLGLIYGYLLSAGKKE